MNGLGAIKWLARVGFLVKGVLYMVIGALALQVAANSGGRVTGTRGALDSAGVARRIVEYRRGDVIFTQGDPCESVLYIQRVA